MTLPRLTELAAMFGEFASAAHPRAPLYVRLARAVADDPRLCEPLLAAPEAQQRPVLLLAAVHRVLFDHPDHELAAYYGSITEADSMAVGDPVPVFRRFCADHAAAIGDLIATRSTQTNEIGRTAPFVLAMSALHDRFGPLGLVDVGASAGLNLLLDRFAYRFAPEDGPAVTIGDTSGGVTLDCGLRGDLPVPSSVPTVAARIGLDRAPLDVGDRDDTAWLLACVWPDQRDRFTRLEAALELARDVRPEVRAGDAVDDLAATVSVIPAGVLAVVMTSWVLTYLEPHRQVAFAAEVDRIGATRDLAWIYLESPDHAPGLPWTAASMRAPERTIVSRVVHHAGRRHLEQLGVAHPHGYWMHATAPATSTVDPPPW